MILVFDCQHHCNSIYAFPHVTCVWWYAFVFVIDLPPRCSSHELRANTPNTVLFFPFFPVAVVAFAAMVGVVLVLVVAAAGIIVTFQLVIRCRYYPLLFSKAAGLPPSESKLREQIESFQGQLPRISCWICKPTTVSIRFIPQDVFTFIPSLHYS